MDIVTFHVEDMTCSHCENAIKKAVGSLEGVSDVFVDLNGKTVSVKFESPIISAKQIVKVIEDLGYVAN